MFPDQNSSTIGCIGLFPLEMNTFNTVLEFITIIMIHLLIYKYTVKYQ